MALDISTAYANYSFLGSEFLTHLWFASENDESWIKNNCQGKSVEITLGNSLTLENEDSLGNKEKITIKGEGANLEEARISLRKGGKVVAMSLQCKVDDIDYHFNLKAQNLDFESLKFKVEKGTDDDELEGFLIEKIYLTSQLTSIFDSLFAHFVTVRISPDWEDQVIPAIKAWIAE